MQLAGLTAREERILELLASGLTTTAIANRLGIATKTVSNILSTIFTKLGVTNRTEAALQVRQAGPGAQTSLDPRPDRRGAVPTMTALPTWLSSEPGEALGPVVTSQASRRFAIHSAATSNAAAIPAK
jgi:DNA-binding CsgD family transcriptional regulator